MWTLLTVAYAIPIVAVMLWGLYEGWGLRGNSFLLRTWHRLLTGDPPSAEELSELLGPAVELVRVAAREAAGESAAPATGPLSAVVSEAEGRSRPVLEAFVSWTVGLIQIDAPSLAARRLPVAELRLRRLKLLARAEPSLAVIGRLFRHRPSTHLTTLRWALRVLLGALHQAERAEPARRARLLADIAADLALVVHDCIESHALARESFLRWRAALPALPEGGGRWKTPYGWMN